MKDGVSVELHSSVATPDILSLEYYTILRMNNYRSKDLPAQYLVMFIKTGCQICAL